jgi:hypothetical protein
MTRRITCLIEEQEDKEKQFRDRELDFKAKRTQEDLQNLSMQKRRAPTPEVVREEVSHPNPLTDPQQ